MPAKSPRQLRFVYAQAAAGVQWAKKWLRDGGYPQPGHGTKKAKRRGA